MSSKTTPTLKAARAAHPLAGAVLRQLGGGADAVQSALDAARHGADGGFGGFTYYTETEAFVKRHRAKIADTAREMASDLGEQGGAVGLVRGFQCLKGRDISEEVVSVALFGGHVRTALEGEVQMVRNALAWFALEEVGHAIERLMEG